MALRCFISIEIPDQIKESIGNIINILKKSDADIKWVSAKNIHLTLKFLGNTDESLIAPITKDLDKILSNYNGFYIKISGIVCFPGEDHPRIICVGAEGNGILNNIHKNIEAEISKFGFPSENRPFSPHLTVGRVRSQGRISEIKKRLDEFRSFSFGSLNIDRISLMKSILKPAGAEYFSLAEIYLGKRGNDVK